MTTLEDAGFLQLQTWFSASFPTGAFAYSHGIEAALHADLLNNAAELEAWLRTLLMVGSARNDAIVFVQAWHAAKADDHAALEHINARTLALCTSAPRRLESTQMGRSFSEAVRIWMTDGEPVCQLAEPALPVVSGAACALCDVPAERGLQAYLHATINHLSWLSARLIPLGQTETLRLLQHLESDILHAVAQSQTRSLDDVGTCALHSDLLAMRHDRLPSRICRT